MARPRPRLVPPEASDEWELLVEQREWLRAASEGAFAPWPRTAAERDCLRALLASHAGAVRDWRERHSPLAPPKPA